MTTPLFNPYRDMPAPDVRGAFERFGQTMEQIRAREDVQKREQMALEIAAQKEEQYRTDLQRAFSDPSAQSFAMLTAKYPQQREAFKQAWEMSDKSKRDDEFKAGIQAFTAIEGGNLDVARNLMDQRIQAMTDRGEDVSTLNALRQNLDRDPKSTQFQLGLVLSSIEPDKFTKIAEERRKAQMQPFELSQKAAEANKAAVQSQYAELATVTDLEKKGWDIWKIQQDAEISRANSQVAALNAKIASEKNEIERQKLEQKKGEFDIKREKLIRDRVAEGENQIASINLLRSTAQDLLSRSVSKYDPETGKPIAYTDTFRAAAGPVDVRFPTLQRDVADFEAAVETAQNQIKLANVDKLKGVLSDSDMKVLGGSIASLDLKQSPEQLVKNLKTIDDLMAKSERLAREKYGLPAIQPQTQPQAPSASEWMVVR